MKTLRTARGIKLSALGSSIWVALGVQGCALVAGLGDAPILDTEPGADGIGGNAKPSEAGTPQVDGAEDTSVNATVWNADSSSVFSDGGADVSVQLGNDGSDLLEDSAVPEQDGAAPDVVSADVISVDVVSSDVVSDAVSVDVAISDGSTADVRDAGSDAPSAPCPGLQVRCDGVCTDLRTNANHCSACGHRCGERSSCEQAACQIVNVHEVTSGAIDDMQADADGVYYLAGGSILACGPAGCPGAPRSVASGVTSAEFVLANGHVAFRGSVPSSTVPSNGVLLCPTSGCVEPKTVLVATNKYVSIQGFAGSSRDVVYSSQYPGISATIGRCAAPVNGACSSKQVIVPTVSSVLLPTETTLFYTATNGDAGMSFFSAPIAAKSDGGAPLGIAPGSYPSYFAYGSDLYFFVAGPSSALAKCPATGCPGGPTRVLTGISSAFAVDSSGYYWIKSGTISMCPLSGCVGGPVTVATGRASPSMLRFTPEFVYWVESSSESTANTIWRVAKPPS